jgi:hypothetical protein
MEQKRIHYTKNYGVGADAQCERHDRHSGKAGRFAQQAKSEVQIPEQRVHGFSPVTSAVMSSEFE